MIDLYTASRPVVLEWVKCQGNVWCSLNRVNLQTVNSLGVYIIFYIDPIGYIRTVRVGQGDVSSRLAEHLQNEEILQFGAYGELFVTWADVPSQKISGVEVYLANTLKPLVGDRFPDVTPIPVNLPFG